MLMVKFHDFFFFFYFSPFEAASSAGRHMHHPRPAAPTLLLHAVRQCTAQGMIEVLVQSQQWQHCAVHHPASCVAEEATLLATEMEGEAAAAEAAKQHGALLR